MFNAVNILEALKNYIHTRGGTSNAYNIAEAVNDLNSIPQGSGGDIPPEVTNAVETHGMGWTSEEEVEGFDIQWDGNTEGRAVLSSYYLVSNIDIDPDGFVGCHYESTSTKESDHIVNFVSPWEGAPEGVYSIYDEIPLDGENAFAIYLTQDISSGETTYPAGLYFLSHPELFTVTRLYKEASTEEVVHQIDQKYIPQSSGGGMVVKVLVTSNDGAASFSADKTIAEIRTAYQSGQTVIAHMYAESGGFDEWLSLTYVDTSGQLWFGFPYPNDEGSPLLMLFAISEDGTDVWGSDLFGNH